MTRPSPYLSWVTWSCTANCSIGGSAGLALKGLAGRWRRVAARAGFITSSMRLPGRRHWFLGYQYVRQCAGLQAGGEGGRTRPGSGGRVLLLDVLAQDRDGRSAGRAGEVRPGPQPSRPPAVLSQAGGFLPQPTGRHAVKASGQPGDRHRGRDVHQQVHALGLAVELGQLGPVALRRGSRSTHPVRSPIETLVTRRFLT
jgi:hypothetical protein